MLDLLEQLCRQVRAFMQSERFNRDQVYAQSADHTTMQFDREAEEIIINGLVESGHGFEIITEERPPLMTSPAPAYRIVVDPVDGSTNVERGIMIAGVSLAVLPIDAPISQEHVQWALLGDLFTGTVYQAQQGLGAFCNGRRCPVRETEHHARRRAGMNLAGRPPEGLQKLLFHRA